MESCHPKSTSIAEIMYPHDREFFCFVCSVEKKVERGDLVHFKCRNQDWFTVCRSCKEKFQGCPHCKQTDCNMLLANNVMNADALKNLFKDVPEIDEMNPFMYMSFSDNQIRVGCTEMPKEKIVCRGFQPSNEAVAHATLEGNEAVIELGSDSAKITDITPTMITTDTFCNSGISGDPLQMVYSFKKNNGERVFKPIGNAKTWSEKILFVSYKYYPAIIATVTSQIDQTKSYIYMCIACNPELPGILVRSKIPALGNMVAIQAVDIPTNFKGFLFNDNNNAFYGEYGMVNLKVVRTSDQKEMQMLWDDIKKVAIIPNAEDGIEYTVKVKPFHDDTFNLYYFNHNEKGWIIPNSKNLEMTDLIPGIFNPNPKVAILKCLLSKEEKEAGMYDGFIVQWHEDENIPNSGIFLKFYPHSV